jgi:hypothetical protein
MKLLALLQLAAAQSKAAELSKKTGTAAGTGAGAGNKYEAKDGDEDAENSGLDNSSDDVRAWACMPSVAVCSYCDDYRCGGRCID